MTDIQSNAAQSKPKLSVVLIMHNEAHNIEDCLNSVNFADEWIVVDSGSSDNSIALAEAKGAKVIRQSWLGFGPQKNVALSHATGDWILSIDADERVTPVLANEIKLAIESSQFDAYDIPRLSQYCGKEIYHSGWWPDYVLRLFKRESGKFSDDVVHERIIANGKIGKLNHYMQHISYRKIEEVLNKVNSYSTAGAQKLLNRKKNISFSSAITHGFWAFFRSYIIQRGFLDGKHGLMLAISNAEGTYYRYLKAWFAQEQNKFNQTTIALIISTYNRPNALRLVLNSLLHQSRLPDEIIIADDGSSEETRDLIASFQPLFKERLQHIWHPDEGFKLAAIRNRAIKHSLADYVVFVDGDCVLPINFVKDHLALAEKGYLVSGSRLLLSESWTKKLEDSQTVLPLFSLATLLKKRISGGINRFLPLIQILPNSSLRKKKPMKWQGAKGCNIAAWREDIDRVDGFDEAFEGWGMEDSDFVIRLQHAGVFHKSGRFYSTVFHLWHKENDRSKLAENQARLAQLLNSDKIKAEKGLSRYLVENNNSTIEENEENNG